MTWSVFCDFDGTVALDDVTDRLLERFAADAWRDLESAWVRGEIGSCDCLDLQISLLEMSPRQLAREIERTEIDGDFPAFVAEARAGGHRVTVLSDGLHPVISAVLARHGLADLPVLANGLRHRGGSSWRLARRHHRGDCRIAAAHCKCASMARLRSGPEGGQRSLLIGDGASDFCAARSADLVFAKGALIGHCRARAVAFAPIRGFADARRLLRDLDRLGRRPDATGAPHLPREAVQDLGFPREDAGR